MGGGGGGPGYIGNVQSLIDKAKKELMAGEQQGKRNVFLSFAYEDVTYVNLLRGQARNENVALEFNLLQEALGLIGRFAGASS